MKDNSLSWRDAHIWHEKGVYISCFISRSYKYIRIYNSIVNCIFNELVPPADISVYPMSQACKSHDHDHQWTDYVMT